MPHFYFDLVENGEILRDDDGVMLGGIEAAKVEARKALADLVREEIRDGAMTRRPGEVAVHIRDHTEGPVVVTVTYDIIDNYGD